MACPVKSKAPAFDEGLDFAREMGQGCKCEIAGKRLPHIAAQRNTLPRCRGQKVRFTDSAEAAFRARIRRVIKDGPFSKAERDVTLAFFNHWFHHRGKQDGTTWPGRERLARTSGVSVKTVSRCLDMLRKAGAIVPEAHLNGLGQNATEYSVDISSLLALCAAKRGTKKASAHIRWDKMSHHSAGQNVPPFLVMSDSEKETFPRSGITHSGTVVKQ